MAVHITGANVQDPTGAAQLLQQYATAYPDLKVIWADGGYAGLFGAYAWNLHQLEVKLTKPERLLDGRSITKKRWVVERTFAWLGRWRRLSKDYEYLVSTSKGWIWLAMSRLMLTRLTRPLSP